jgi:hypothetical protein
MNTIGNALGAVAKQKDAIKSVGEIANAAASAGKNTYDIVKPIKQKQKTARTKCCSSCYR